MIVSDSTTLIILCDLDRMALLSNLFEKVTIPKAVYEEVVKKECRKIPDFIEVADVRKGELLDIVSSVLDKGESEAIVLAKERGEPLIIDEKKGRKVAKRYGIPVIGLLGIVYLNIEKRYVTVSEARAFLEESKNHGYRISARLVEEMFASLS